MDDLFIFGQGSTTSDILMQDRNTKYSSKNNRRKRMYHPSNPVLSRNQLSGPVDDSQGYSLVIDQDSTDDNNGINCPCSICTTYRNFNPLSYPGKYVSRKDRIGQGTFGRVYKGKDNRGKEFATKVYRHPIDNMYSISREISILSTLRHPNIIRVFDVEIKGDGDSIALVMELMSGDLVDVIHWNIEHRIDLIQSISFQLLLGLEFLHKQGFTHRDIKSRNILIKRVDGLSKYILVKIADFGLARRMKDESTEYYTQDVITQPYRPPELLFRGDSNVYYNTKVDIWSAGICLVELVQGITLDKMTGHP